MVALLLTGGFCHFADETQRGIKVMDVVDRFEQALLRLDKHEAQQIVTEADAASAPLVFTESVVATALNRIGDAWQNGDVALSQVYMSGRICEQLIDAILTPAVSARKKQPKMAVTVLGDYHLLGKRIVYSVLRSAGFELLDYGRTEVNELVARVCRDGIEVLLISTLMYPSALRVKEVRAKLEELAYPVAILVGGAPFNLDGQLWREVGADAMGRTASEAVELATGMMQEVKS